MSAHLHSLACNAMPPSGMDHNDGFGIFLRWLLDWVREGASAGTCALFVIRFARFACINRVVSDEAKQVMCHWPLQKHVASLLQAHIADDQQRTVQFHNRRIAASEAVVRIVKALSRFRRSHHMIQRPAAIPRNEAAFLTYWGNGSVKEVSTGMISIIHKRFCHVWLSTSDVRDRIPRQGYAQLMCDALIRDEVLLLKHMLLPYARASSEPHIVQSTSVTVEGSRRRRSVSV